MLYHNHAHKCEHNSFSYTPVKTAKTPSHQEKPHFHTSDRDLDHPPRWMTSSLMRFFSSTNSAPSLEARNRRERCWFILARGAWQQ